MPLKTEETGASEIPMPTSPRGMGKLILGHISNLCNNVTSKAAISALRKYVSHFAWLYTLHRELLISGVLSR